MVMNISVQILIRNDSNGYEYHQILITGDDDYQPILISGDGDEY